MRRGRNDQGRGGRELYPGGLFDDRPDLKLVSGSAMVRALAIFACIFCLTGCPSGPPVQEMSDARQAITAARTAGATEASSPDLYAAQAAITRAEEHLQAQEYVRARYAAQQAKHHAALALDEAQHAENQHVDAPIPQ